MIKSPFPEGVVLVGLGCVGLALLGWALTPSGGPITEDVVNGFISVATIGLVTALALRVQQTEATLRSQASLLDLTHAPIFSRDMNGKILYWNRGAEELYGFRCAEALGAVAHTLLKTTFITPVEQIMAELLREGGWEGELVERTADGTPLVVTSRWTIQRDNQGRPAMIQETTNDITERKRMEDALQQAQSDLARMNRVLLVGEMTASIAHEVRQPIAAVVTSASAGLRWLDADPPALEEVRQVLTHIVEDGNRAGNVLDRIRALVNKAPPRIERWDLTDAIGEVLALTRPELLRQGGVLRNDLSYDVPLVKGDRVQLQQVLMNLIVNAVEAMSCVHDRPRELTIRTVRAGLSEAMVEVRDTGTGVAPGHRERLFQSFYTTKAEGMGMGLAISRSIVEEHGGRLETAPNQPHGAIFRFTLPTEENAHASPEACCRIAEKTTQCQ
jgi:two-component system sensor kinase FixL